MPKRCNGICATAPAFLLLFGTPHTFGVDEAPGLLLVMAPTGGLTSCALSPQEITTLTCAPGTWVRVHGDRVQHVILAELNAIDAAVWIDVGAWTVEDVCPFGTDPHPTAPRLQSLREDTKSTVRDLLGDKAPATDAQRDELLASLESGSNTTSASTPAGVRGWFQRLFPSDGPRAGYPQQLPAASQGHAAPPSGPRPSRTPLPCPCGALRTQPTHWTQATVLERWAPAYDGQTWYVAADGRVLAIDAQADTFDALWSVGGLPAPCVAIASSNTHMRFATVGDSNWLWTYELGKQGPVLRGKSVITVPDPHDALRIGPSGATVSWVLRQDENEVLASYKPLSGTSVTRQLSVPTAVHGWGSGITYCTRSDTGVAVHHLDAQSFSPAWSLEFVGSDRCDVHVVGDRLVVFDAQGRVVIVGAGGEIDAVVRTQA